MATEVRREGIIQLKELDVPEGYDYSKKPEEAWEHCCGICDSGTGCGGEP